MPPPKSHNLVVLAIEEHEHPIHESGVAIIPSSIVPLNVITEELRSATIHVDNEASSTVLRSPLQKTPSKSPVPPLPLHRLKPPTFYDPVLPKPQAVRELSFQWNSRTRLSSVSPTPYKPNVRATNVIAAAKDIEEDDIKPATPPLIVYNWRFVVLLVLALQTASSSMQGLLFAPIQGPTRAFYGVASTLINLLFVLFLVINALLSLSAPPLLAAYGLKRMVILGALFNTIGAWVKYGGYSPSSYWALLMGQMIASIAQPIFNSTPTLVAARWFPEKQRMMATGIGGLAILVGYLGAYILSPAVVSSASDVPTLLLIEALIITACSLALVLVRERPPTPPSVLADVPRPTTLAGIKVAIRTPGFVVLTAAFGVWLGAFTTFISLINQLILPNGYSTNESGQVGALVLSMGIVGIIVVSLLVDRSRAYKTYLIACFVASAACLLWFALTIEPNHTHSLLACAPFLGMSSLPLLPLSLEMGVELLYPASESIAVAVLLCVGQIFSVAFIFAVDVLEVHAKSANAAVWTLFAAVSIALVLVVFGVRPEYRRLEAEKAARAAGDRVKTDDKVYTPTYNFTRPAVIIQPFS
eukprot:CAMPEP_0184649642 /NCGR_PEP_ID=MMETSP0308-20130426/7038_1 /TAXON_ID=38269 /ORGANISM="Gloeochaete witrockiana, Strain SAG 46.84" /LENGTH=585 /DNA_ID=CAMNT_0027082521 /DNA_START=98 /DNA_END=1855 /DNA_ORIENTATION=+